MTKSLIPSVYLWLIGVELVYGQQQFEGRFDHFKNVVSTLRNGHSSEEGYSESQTPLFNGISEVGYAGEDGDLRLPEIVRTFKGGDELSKAGGLRLVGESSRLSVPSNRVTRLSTGNTVGMNGKQSILSGVTSNVLVGTSNVLVGGPETTSASFGQYGDQLQGVQQIGLNGGETRYVGWNPADVESSGALLQGHMTKVPLNYTWGALGKLNGLQGSVGLSSVGVQPQTVVSDTGSLAVGSAPLGYSQLMGTFGPTLPQGNSWVSNWFNPAVQSNQHQSVVMSPSVVLGNDGLQFANTAAIPQASLLTNYISSSPVVEQHGQPTFVHSEGPVSVFAEPPHEGAVNININLSGHEEHAPPSHVEDHAFNHGGAPTEIPVAININLIGDENTRIVPEIHFNVEPHAEGVTEGQTPGLNKSEETLPAIKPISMVEQTTVNRTAIVEAISGSEELPEQVVPSSQFEKNNGHANITEGVSLEFLENSKINWSTGEITNELPSFDWRESQSIDNSVQNDIHADEMKQESEIMTNTDTIDFDVQGKIKDAPEGIKSVHENTPESSVQKESSGDESSYWNLYVSTLDAETPTFGFSTTQSLDLGPEISPEVTLDSSAINWDVNSDSVLEQNDRRATEGELHESINLNFTENIDAVAPTFGFSTTQSLDLGPEISPELRLENDFEQSAQEPLDEIREGQTEVNGTITEETVIQREEAPEDAQSAVIIGENETILGEKENIVVEFPSQASYFDFDAANNEERTQALEINWLVNQKEENIHGTPNIEYNVEQTTWESEPMGEIREENVEIDQTKDELWTTPMTEYLQTVDEQQGEETGAAELNAGMNQNSGENEIQRENESVPLETSLTVNQTVQDGGGIQWTAIYTFGDNLTVPTNKVATSSTVKDTTWITYNLTAGEGENDGSGGIGLNYVNQGGQEGISAARSEGGYETEISVQDRASDSNGSVDPIQLSLMSFNVIQQGMKQASDVRGSGDIGVISKMNSSLGKKFDGYVIEQSAQEDVGPLEMQTGASQIVTTVNKTIFEAEQPTLQWLEVALKPVALQPQDEALETTENTLKLNVSENFQRTWDIEPEFGANFSQWLQVSQPVNQRASSSIDFNLTESPVESFGGAEDGNYVQEFSQTILPANVNLTEFSEFNVQVNQIDDFSQNQQGDNFDANEVLNGDSLLSQRFGNFDSFADQLSVESSIFENESPQNEAQSELLGDRYGLMNMMVAGGVNYTGPASDVTTNTAIINVIGTQNGEADDQSAGNVVIKVVDSAVDGDVAQTTTFQIVSPTVEDAASVVSTTITTIESPEETPMVTVAPGTQATDSVADGGVVVTWQSSGTTDGVSDPTTTVHVISPAITGDDQGSASTTTVRVTSPDGGDVTAATLATTVVTGLLSSDVIGRTTTTVSTASSDAPSTTITTLTEPTVTVAHQTETPANELQIKINALLGTVGNDTSHTDGPIKHREEDDENDDTEAKDSNENEVDVDTSWVATIADTDSQEETEGQISGDQGGMRGARSNEALDIDSEREPTVTHTTNGHTSEIHESHWNEDEGAESTPNSSEDNGDQTATLSWENGHSVTPNDELYWNVHSEASQTGVKTQGNPNRDHLWNHHMSGSSPEGSLSWNTGNRSPLSHTTGREEGWSRLNHGDGQSRHGERWLHYSRGPKIIFGEQSSNIRGKPGADSNGYGIQWGHEESNGHRWVGEHDVSPLITSSSGNIQHHTIHRLTPSSETRWTYGDSNTEPNHRRGANGNIHSNSISLHGARGEHQSAAAQRRQSSGTDSEIQWSHGNTQSGLSWNDDEGHPSGSTGYQTWSQRGPGIQLYHENSRLSPNMILNGPNSGVVTSSYSRPGQHGVRWINDHSLNRDENHGDHWSHSTVTTEKHHGQALSSTPSQWISWENRRNGEKLEVQPDRTWVSQGRDETGSEIRWTNGNPGASGTRWTTHSSSPLWITGEDGQRLRWTSDDPRPIFRQPTSYQWIYGDAEGNPTQPATIRESTRTQGLKSRDDHQRQNDEPQFHWNPEMLNVEENLMKSIPIDDEPSTERESPGTGKNIENTDELPHETRKSTKSDKTSSSSIIISSSNDETPTVIVSETGAGQSQEESEVVVKIEPSDDEGENNVVIVAPSNDDETTITISSVPVNQETSTTSESNARGDDSSTKLEDSDSKSKENKSSGGLFRRALLSVKKFLGEDSSSKKQEENREDKKEKENPETPGNKDGEAAKTSRTSG